jgi:uncharacterized membrane protein
MNMANQDWLDEVLKRLLRQGLPPVYVKRLTEELSDHLEDITEENMEADAISRLGQPEEVADNAAVAYRRRSFLGRHSWTRFVVFCISPIMSLIGLSLLSVALLLLTSTCMGTGDGNNLGPVASAAVCFAASFLMIVIPSILASVFYCRLAERAGVSRTWIVVSCITLAVVASGPASWRAGVGARPWMFGPCWSGLWYVRDWVPQVQHLIQFLVPLVIGCWFMRRSRNHDQLQLAS